MIGRCLLMGTGSGDGNRCLPSDLRNTSGSSRATGFNNQAMNGSCEPEFTYPISPRLQFSMRKLPSPTAVFPLDINCPVLKLPSVSPSLKYPWISATSHEAIATSIASATSLRKTASRCKLCNEFERPYRRDGGSRLSAIPIRASFEVNSEKDFQPRRCMANMLNQP